MKHHRDKTIRIFNYIKSMQIYESKFLYITPVVKYPTVVIPAEAGHEVKPWRYPERHWMPDQVRHDGVGMVIWLNTNKDKIFGGKN
ncbi:MAG: hypothetical protein ABFS43_10530 [Thermodesulfobacteriota bacterium]